jgi:hypothetical protein
MLKIDDNSEMSVGVNQSTAIAELQLTRHGSSCWGGQALKQPSTHVFNTAVAYFRHVCHAKR